MMNYTFTEDWLGDRIVDWDRVLDSYKGRPGISVLEIGSFEGRSATWFLENILGHPTAHMVCIDPEFPDLFFENIRPFAHKVRAIENTSQVALRDPFFSENKFDVIYIDGGHSACLVLEDAVLCFRILKPGGIMIFDDYLWTNEDPVLEPKLGIDCFLRCFEGQYEVVHQAYQVILRKNNLR